MRILLANVCTHISTLPVISLLQLVVKMNQDSGSANDVKTKVGTKYQVLTNT